jgi:hypothetical protein
MFETYSTRAARVALVAGFPFPGPCLVMALPAFLGSGAFLASPDPRGPDEDDMERWEDDGGPSPPED